MYKNRIWVPSQRDGWNLVEEIDRPSNNTVVYLDKGVQQTIQITECCEYCESDTDDLTTLTHLNEANLLESLRLRYLRNCIYTNTGRVLLAVNPFQKLDLYNLSDLSKYYQIGESVPNENNDKPPHVYSKAGDCLEDLRYHQRPQSILVSGESGSGKTQTSKYIMKFFSETSSTSQSGIEDVFLQSNPVLESFGNAKTRRNNNSSRFGKYAKVYFKDSQIIGASTTTYLLEKTRFIHQPSGEGNFHIVYQILAAAEENTESVVSISNCRYITHPEARRLTDQTDVSGEESHNHLHNTLSAMQKLGFTTSNIETIIQLVKGLLSLSNIRGTPDNLLEPCKLLQIPVKDAQNAFFYKTITVGGETIKTPLSPEDSLATCNTFSKAVYGALFKWIVEQINSATEPMDIECQHTIGILDIFGFEVFNTNGFEQFCINFANEKLQELFNDQLITAQQKEYLEEGISWSKIDFRGNEVCLQEVQQIFFPLLDEASRLQSGGDTNFASRFKRQSQKNNTTCLVFPKSDPPSTFQISHFAGQVEYTVKGFCDRNVDRIHPSLTHLLRQSESRMVVELAEHIPVPEVSSLAFKSVSHQFSKGLSNLIRDLQKTDIHYIRCIKPNDNDQPSSFVNVRVSEQLRYSGVLEAVRVSRAGFPVRFLHQQFQERYSLNQDPTADQEGIKKGKSKYFLKHHSYVKLEKELVTIRHAKAIIIQTKYRQYHQRTTYLTLLQYIVRLQSSIRSLLSQRCLFYHKRARLIQTWHRKIILQEAYGKTKRQIIIIQRHTRLVLKKRHQAASTVIFFYQYVQAKLFRSRLKNSVAVIERFWLSVKHTRARSQKQLLVEKKEKERLQLLVMEQSEEMVKKDNELQIATDKLRQFEQDAIQKLAEAKAKAESILEEVKLKAQQDRLETEKTVQEEKVKNQQLQTQLLKSESEIQSQNATLERSGKTKIEILSQMEDIVQENDRMRNELEFYRQVWEKNQQGTIDPSKCTLQ